MTAQIIVTGNVGNEIEFFTFGQGGEGMKFDVAVNEIMRDGANNVRWYKIAVFGRLKDQAKQLNEEGKIVTGSKVLIMGEFKPREYATRSGETRISFDVTASSVEVLTWPRAQAQQAQYTSQDEDYGYPADDDDFPGF